MRGSIPRPCQYDQGRNKKRPASHEGSAVMAADVGRAAAAAKGGSKMTEGEKLTRGWLNINYDMEYEEECESLTRCIQEACERTLEVFEKEGLVYKPHGTYNECRYCHQTWWDNERSRHAFDCIIVTGRWWEQEAKE